MLTLSQLPRKDALVVGRYWAKHSSDTFAEAGFGFKFADGKTVYPVTARICDRLGAAYGGAISFVPVDDETIELVVEHALEYVPEQAEALDAMLDELRTQPKRRKPQPAPAALVEQSSAASPSEASADAAPAADAGAARDRSRGAPKESKASPATRERK